MACANNNYAIQKNPRKIGRSLLSWYGPPREHEGWVHISSCKKVVKLLFCVCFRSSPMVLNMWSCTAKIRWRKVKTCHGFDQEIGFFLAEHNFTVAVLMIWRRLLISVSLIGRPIIMIRPGDLLLVIPVSVLLVGVPESKQLNLDVKKGFCRVTYWAPLEMMLFSWWKVANFFIALE